MLTTVAVSGYRSLRDVVVELGPLTVVTGPNGSGKSSLYRALRLLADCGAGRVVGSLAAEGGLPSALWAGPETTGGSRRGHGTQGTVRKGPVSVRLGVADDDGFGYLVDLGLPQPHDSAFTLDPEVKRETVFSGPVARPAAVLVERIGPFVRTRDGGDWRQLTSHLGGTDSMLTELVDPERAPELLAVRHQLRGWRLYDGFRVDRDAPARQARVGTRTPVLDPDGGSLAAALQTIVEIGDAGALAETVADAFGGSQVLVRAAAGRFDLALQQPGMLRPLAAAELSDGTLRYLLLVAALLSPRPPRLMVLNEPETSLHPDLLPALGRLLQRAAEDTQVVVVSHASALVDALEARRGGVTRIALAKDPDGQTVVEGQEGPLDRPAWHWGAR